MEGKDPMNRALFCHVSFVIVSKSRFFLIVIIDFFFIVKCIFVLGFIFVNLSCPMYALTWF